MDGNKNTYCYSTEENPENDELRARFTSWLTTMLFRAKIKYLDNQKQKVDVVSLDEIPADLIEDPSNHFSEVERNGNDFDFEEERLARAFYELPLMRREVLRLLFVEEKTPREISVQLHCSENYVHLQKSRAMKKLREALVEGDDRYNE